MSYSDRDMLVLTQLAYYRFNQEIIAENGYNATVRELLEQDPGVLSCLQDQLRVADSDAERYRAEQALELYNEIISEDSEYGDWIIRSVRDDNVNTGFYGVLLETPSGDGLVGFRGSESYDMTQTVNDWVLADFGLITGDNTAQQNQAELFMHDIYENYNYDNYYLSGHSLGGNLSFHAAITAPEEMQSRIHSYSYDGPGYSAEYLLRYQDEIQRTQGRLTHYQWSVIGDLLIQPWGTENRVVSLEENSVIGPVSFQRHDTCFVEFDENGNVIDGQRDALSTVSNKYQLSELVDLRFNTVEVVCLAMFNVLEEFEEAAENAVYQMQNVFSEVKDRVVNYFKREIFSNFYDSGTVADYKVDLSAMQNIFGRLENYSSDLRNIAEGVESVARNLRDSFSGPLLWGLRTRVTILSNEVNSQNRKMSKLKRAGNSVVESYSSTERTVVRNYSNN